MDLYIKRGSRTENITCLPQLWRNVRRIDDLFYVGLRSASSGPEEINDYSPLNDIKENFDYVNNFRIFVGDT